MVRVRDEIDGSRCATIDRSGNVITLMALLRKTRWWFCILLAQLLALASVQAQEVLRVDVLVADQGAGERNLGYRLSLDSLLRNVLPLDTVSDAERGGIVRNAGNFVQSFRYRRFDPQADAGAIPLSTDGARQPDSLPSVLSVTYPAELADLIRAQLAPEPEIVESQLPQDARILALIAVDQQGRQILIGGKTGVKFQNRALQLARASDLQLVFPEMNELDRQAIGPADVLYDQREAQELTSTRYQIPSRLTGALIRLTSGSWQSEWRYSRPGSADSTYRLTTSNLDEALVNVIGELAIADQDNGSGELNPLFGSTGIDAPETGLALRVGNIASLNDYHQALALIQQIDDGALAETLQADSVVFRLTTEDEPALIEQLARSGRFVQAEPPLSDTRLPSPRVLSYRYAPR